MERNDLANFQQLRQQLLDSMQAAARAYNIQAPPDDPAGLLYVLRQGDLIDATDLRLAEGILALCDRVRREGRAGLDEYRQALTLYLLFHRSRLHR